MLKITKQNNSIVVEGVNNYKYPDNAVLSFPLNSIICQVDESDIITFHSASNYDVLFSGNVDEITINGESVTKENVGDKFGAISNTISGGGLTPEQEEKLNNSVQIANYNADKEAQATIDENQNSAIEGLRGNIESKQDKIDDLNAIREGAEKGATAIQSETDPIWTAEKGNYYTKNETDGLVNEAKTAASSAMSVASSAEGIASTANSKADEALRGLENKANKSEIPSLDGYATKVWVGEQGYLTEHQDISGKLDKTEAAATYQLKGNYATKAEIPSLDGYATESWVEGNGYLTEHQSLKTINGQTIVGDGNIEIKGGGGGIEGGLLSFNTPIITDDGDTYKFEITRATPSPDGEGIDYRFNVRCNDVQQFKYMSGTLYRYNGSNSLSFNSRSSGTYTHTLYIPFTYILKGCAASIEINNKEFKYFDFANTLLKDSVVVTINNNSLFKGGNIEVQDTLVSGTNIKTINGESILGSGNIEIQSGGGEETDPIWTAEKVNYYTKTEVDEMIGNINNALATLING